MFKQLHQLLGGSSPVTGYIGSTIIALDVAQAALIQGGVPEDAGGWFYFGLALLTGLGVRFSKDAGRSNATHPLPVSQPVEAKPS